MNDVLILVLICIVLFTVSALYALFLQLNAVGQWLTRKRTWITVVIGVGYVQAALAFVLPFGDWLKVLAIFASSSLPIIARSLYKEQLWDAELEEYLAAKGSAEEET